MVNGVSAGNTSLINLMKKPEAKTQTQAKPVTQAKPALQTPQAQKTDKKTKNMLTYIPLALGVGILVAAGLTGRKDTKILKGVEEAFQKKLKNLDCCMDFANETVENAQNTAIKKLNKLYGANKVNVDKLMEFESRLQSTTSVEKALLLKEEVSEYVSEALGVLVEDPALSALGEKAFGILGKCRQKVFEAKKTVVDLLSTFEKTDGVENFSMHNPEHVLSYSKFVSKAHTNFDAYAIEALKKVDYVEMENTRLYGGFAKDLTDCKMRVDSFFNDVQEKIKELSHYKGNESYTSQVKFGDESFNIFLN